MGLILLSLLALATVAFILSAGAIRTRSLMETRHHYKELEAQRLLADKAEASRFTELRQYLEENLRQLRERDTILTTELQRELRSQSEASNRMLAARLNELEHRMDSRFERLGVGGGRAAAAVPAMGSQPVPEEPLRAEGMHNPVMGERDPAQDAEEQRLAQMRDEERLREERLRQERELRAVEGDRPNEQSGWRRWF